jgi:hypothetical protein
VILAIRLLILRILAVLKTSVASMTSTDMITSLASMTSTASLALKNQKQHALYTLSDFPGIRNLSSLNDLNSLNNLSGLNDLNSLISSKKHPELDVSINPATKMAYSGLLMWDGSSNIYHFMDFWHPSCWRLWRTGMLLLTKLKDHKSNVHYSDFPNHLQTKSNLNISIPQSKLKHKCLPLDTL